MLHMKFPPTTQQLEEAGFEKGQAEALAACFASQDQKLDGIIMLLQHLAQKVDAVEKKVDATNQKLVDFQLQTERKFSETNQKISDTKVFVVLWTAGIVIVAAGGMYAAVRDLLVNVLHLGAG